MDAAPDEGHVTDAAEAGSISIAPSRRQRRACPDPLCYIENADSSRDQPHGVNVPSDPALRKKWLRTLQPPDADAQRGLLAVQA